MYDHPACVDASWLLEFQQFFGPLLEEDQSLGILAKPVAVLPE